MNIRWYWVLPWMLVCAGPVGCAPRDSCTTAELESEMDSVLSQVQSDVDFTFAVTRGDGRRYVYNRGASTLQTRYESASTSKLVSAVIILRQVARGVLSLADRPQDLIPSWPIGSDDPLYAMTLAQLLSFTSGLESDAFCQNQSNANFAQCVNQIAEANAGNGVTPGSSFYYASSHLQVAGLMAVRARGAADWQTLFSEFQAETGLFPTATYDLPSTTNPRLAGGMHWMGEEYLGFLAALREGALLSSSTMAQMLADQTAGAAIAFSPSQTGLREDWHYGFGLWHECQSRNFNCTAGTRVSSPGAYGAYPFWDRARDYYGILARQGTLGTFVRGVIIERIVRPKVKTWLNCE